MTKPKARPKILGEDDPKAETKATEHMGNTSALRGLFLSGQGFFQNLDTQGGGEREIERQENRGGESPVQEAEMGKGGGDNGTIAR